MKKKNLIIILCTLVVILAGALAFKWLFFKDQKETNESGNTIVKEKVEENKFEVSYSNEEYVGKNSNGKNKRNIPVIKSETNQQVADKIQKSLKEISDKEWNNANSALDEAENSDGIGIEEYFLLEKTSKSYIVFSYEQSGDMGGVSWNDKKFYTYNTATGDLLKIEDILTDATQKEKIVSLVISELENSNYKSELFKNWKDSIKEEINKNGVWNLGKEGVEIYFEKYSIAPGASGNIEINIYYEKINGYLKDEYKG